VQALEDGDIRIDGTPDDIRRELKEYGDWCVESNAGTGVWRCHCSELPIKYYNQMADVFASGLPQSAFF
jgi:hypothetical protein